MSRIFDSLPGIEMPVKQVMETLSTMWEGTSGTGAADMESRASQLNLILHFGLSTSPDEAKRIFESSIRFAQQYPCRIIVLCPADSGSTLTGFQGKLFSECYIGKNLREICCCEALILGYSIDQSDFLDNQVSIWLESDLPVYHWFHRVPADRITQMYLEFVKHCRRVVYDGEIEGNSMDHVPWPQPQRVSDLAYARTLPVRRHLGQFLSGYPPALIVEGLRCLRIQYHLGLRRTAYHLLRWHRRAIEKCFKKPADADSVVFTIEQLVQEGTGCCLKIDWEYEDRGKSINWNYEQSQESGIITANLGTGTIRHPIHVEPLNEEQTLPEALFFG